jgi:hypothetical protein
MSVIDLPRHLKPNSLSWFKFHSSQKRKLLSLGGYDIIITTYETLMGQMKKHNDPTWTNSTLFSFAWHRIVLDEGIFPAPNHPRLADTVPQPTSSATDPLLSHKPAVLFERADGGQ